MKILEDATFAFTHPRRFLQLGVAMAASSFFFSLQASGSTKDSGVMSLNAAVKRELAAAGELMCFLSAGHSSDGVPVGKPLRQR